METNWTIHVWMKYYSHFASKVFLESKSLRTPLSPRPSRTRRTHDSSTPCIFSCGCTWLLRSVLLYLCATRVFHECCQYLKYAKHGCWKQQLHWALQFFRFRVLEVHHVHGLRNYFLKLTLLFHLAQSGELLTACCCYGFKCVL